MEINNVLQALQAQQSSSGTATASSSTGTATAQAQDINQDTFLKLFVTQLQNQDPLNPMDPSGMLSQLAQFTALEQQTQSNDLLKNLLSAIQSQSQFDLMQFVGREVVTQGNTVSLPQSGGTSLSYDLGGNANNVTVSILDSNGQLVRTIQEGAQAQGRQVVEWDGLDGNGNPLPEGTYSFQVQATDSNGSGVTAQTYASEQVVGTSWANGQGELLLQSGRTITQDQILAAG